MPHKDRNIKKKNNRNRPKTNADDKQTEKIS